MISLRRRKPFSVLMALVMCLGMSNITAQAETVKNGYTVTVFSSDVEITVDKTSSVMTDVGSETIYDDASQEIPKKDQYYDSGHYHYDKVEKGKLTLTEPPEEADYALVGFAEYSWYYDTMLKVYYQRDDAGNILYNDDAEPLIDHLTRAYDEGRGSLKDSDGNIIKTLDYPFTAGTRPVIFWLKNKAGEYVCTYCTDIITDTVDGAWYTVANLEDCTYYEEGTLAKLRAIVENGYWGSSKGTGSLNSIVEKLTAAIKDRTIEDYIVTTKTTTDDAGNETTDNVWLSDMIGDLTEGEALDATAAAIWTYANNDNCDAVVYTGSTRSGVPNDRVRDARRLAYYNWLINLEGEEASTTVINEANFVEDLSITVDRKVQESEDGDKDVFEASLNFALATIPTEKDNLLMTIAYPDENGDETSVTVRLAGENAAGESYEKLTAVDGYYTIDGLELTENEAFAINMRLVGDQYLEQDVYFYSPVGGRDASQSMIGLAEGTHTVDISMSAKVKFNAEEYVDRIIKFNKTTEVGGVSYPLEGIQFDLYYLCTVDEYTENLKTSATYEKPSLNLVDADDFVATVKTDASGNASYNLTENGNPDGIYLVVEKEHPAIVQPLDPFYVAVPMTTEDGSGLIYTVDLKPKNTVVPGPDVYKDIMEIGQDSDSFDVGEEHTWIIRGEVPSDIADAKEYVISDKLDYRLTYAEDLVVKVEKITDKANNSVSDGNVLTAGTDYILEVSKDTVTVSGGDLEDIQKFEVSLTADGMDKVAQIADAATGDETYEIRVYFNAVIDEDASVGEKIPNQAALKYTNSVNFKYETDSDEPVVYTCGINIYKHDAKDKNVALNGAVFKLAKVVAQETEGAAPLVTKEGSKYVVYEEFYTTADLDGNKVNSVTTGENGDAVIYGLEEGTYYLIEIQAPEGYNLLSYPVVVKLDQNSHLENNVLEVANSNTFKLPDTGGIGTTVFNVGGMTLIALAVSLLILNRKKEYENA